MFKKAYELVFTAESVRDQQRHIQSSQQQAVNFDVLVRRQNVRECFTSKAPQYFRLHRKYWDHKPDKFFFKNAACNFCCKKGRIAKVCLSKKAKLQQYQGIHHLEEDEVLEQQENSLLTIFRTGLEMTTSARFVVTVRLSGRPLKMEIDPEVAFSIVNGATFARLWPDDALVLRERRLALHT